MTSGSKILVWDLPVRVMHWALPILVVCAWLTRKLEGDWFAWHVRCGDVVGEHTVQFTGQGERIELVHRATNRDIFAQGALFAAEKIHGKLNGHYRFDDLL